MIYDPHENKPDQRQRKFCDVDWTIPEPPQSWDVAVAVLMDIRHELKLLRGMHSDLLAIREKIPHRLNDAINGLASQLGTITNRLNQIEQNTKKKKIPKLPPDDTPLTDLGLSTRVRRCLNSGVAPEPKTAGDIRKLTPRELLTLPNFGYRSLKEVQRIVGGLKT